LCSWLAARLAFVRGSPRGLLVSARREACDPSARREACLCQLAARPAILQLAARPALSFICSSNSLSRHFLDRESACGDCLAADRECSGDYCDGTPRRTRGTSCGDHHDGEPQHSIFFNDQVEIQLGAELYVHGYTWY
jgi:hypothetical protein